MWVGTATGMLHIAKRRHPPCACGRTVLRAWMAFTRIGSACLWMATERGGLPA